MPLRQNRLPLSAISLWPQVETDNRLAIWGRRMALAISMPPLWNGATTRVAPARRSLRTSSSASARARITARSFSSRAVKVIRMFSASESTADTT